jgi:hypothetical protein
LCRYTTELESIKLQYMGQKKEKKKTAKPSDKFKFKFDWEPKEDTGRDLNPLYDKPHEGQLLFGRGLRAGVDRRQGCTQSRGVVVPSGTSYWLKPQTPLYNNQSYVSFSPQPGRVSDWLYSYMEHTAVINGTVF